MTGKSLLSIGQLCDDGYHATFTADHVQLTKHGSSHVIGHRDPTNGLWNVPLLGSHQPTNTFPVTSVSNSAYEMQTLPDLVTYLHRACFSPVPATWTKAIDAGYFATWPGLTSDLVRKHLAKSVATAKGHLRQDRKNVRSTKPTAPLPAPEPTTRTHCAFTKIILISGTLYSDQTGHFPTTSSRGSKYVMIFYDFDSSAILAEPLKSRSASELLRAFSKLHQHLTDRGLRPALQILDNECPATLKTFMLQSGTKYQLAPPNIHRTNAAEKAIDTWKCHFIAGLSSLDPNFPLHLWCRLIPQATTTLNLLRPSRINPRLSAEAQLNGAFDFNRSPLAPPGTRVLVHETPANRRTWAPHGVDGWYLGAAAEHYRCYRVYVTKTASERIAKTVQFFPHKCAMPKTSSADVALRAAHALVQALKHPSPAAPFATLGQAQLQALDQLAHIFDTATAPFNHTATSPRVPLRTETTPPPRVTPVPAVRPLRVPPLRPPANRTSTAPPPRVPTLIEPDPGDPVLHRYPLRSNNNPPHSLANSVIDAITGQALEYRHLSKGPNAALWIQALANDLGRLAQGVGTRMPTGTNTIFFISRNQVPIGRKVTYGRLVSSIRPTKSEIHRVRVTVGGDRLDYPGITSTSCASLTTTKCLLNSTLSTPQARFMVLDIKNFYYGTPMDRYEYMKLPIGLIPDEIVVQYKLHDLVHDGYVYLEIRKGMPGLKQAGRIASERLTKHLAKSGYSPVARTPSLWKHDHLPIMFSLVVDDFGVKYTGDATAKHLISALQSLYIISIDWTGQLYLGLTLKWDYVQRTVDISMPGYVHEALHRFQHLAPSRSQDAPHDWNQPTYGAKIQYADAPDASPLLEAKTLTFVQSVVGTLLYYAIAVDPTMLVALGDLSSEQTKATADTWDRVTWLLDYAHTHPDATIRYVASDMWLHVHSDASYLSVIRARSRAGGHFTLSDKPKNPIPTPTPTPTPNGPIHVTCKIMGNVLGSAAEAEIGAAYINA